MKSLTLYVDKKSFLHAIDPVTKLFYIAFVILLPIFVPDIKVSGFCCLLSIVLLVSAGVFRQSLPVFALISSALLTVLIVQGLFGVHNENESFRIGFLVFYKEGLQISIIIILRVINIVSAFLVLILTVRPSDLVEELMRRGLSPKIGYVVDSVFQIIPQMLQTVTTISDAQRSRGMEMEGSLFIRIKALLPLMGPVVISALNNTKERAMALEARAFNAKNQRSFLNEPKTFSLSIPLRGGMALILLAALVWRIFG